MRQRKMKGRYRNPSVIDGAKVDARRRVRQRLLIPVPVIFPAAQIAPLFDEEFEIVAPSLLRHLDPADIIVGLNFSYCVFKQRHVLRRYFAKCYEALAERGVTATHAPGCDLPQGWGVSPVAALRRAGIAVGLGTSGGGSNDAGHLLADARLAMQIAPLAGGASGSGGGLAAALTARDVLTMATRGSSLGLGRDDLGRIEPGKAADLCCYDMSGVSDAGVEDRLAALVWTSPGRRPRHVVVGGRVVVRDYRLVTVDEAVVAADLMDLLGSRRKEYLNV